MPTARHSRPSYPCVRAAAAAAAVGDSGRRLHELPWLYLDSVGQEYGPVPGWTMREWLTLGRFPVGGELRVRLPEWERHLPLHRLFPDLGTAFMLPPAWPDMYDDDGVREGERGEACRAATPPRRRPEAAAERPAAAAAAAAAAAPSSASLPPSGVNVPAYGGGGGGGGGGGSGGTPACGASAPACGASAPACGASAPAGGASAPASRVGPPAGCAGAPMGCAGSATGCAGARAGCAGAPMGCAGAPMGCASAPADCASAPAGCAGAPAGCAGAPAGCAVAPAGCAGAPVATAGCGGEPAGCNGGLPQGAAAPVRSLHKLVGSIAAPRPGGDHAAAQGEDGPVPSSAFMRLRVPSQAPAATCGERARPRSLSPPQPRFLLQKIVRRDWKLPSPLQEAVPGAAADGG